VHLAANDDLAQALRGLTASGAGNLPCFAEFAVRHPHNAVDIQAAWELATGRPGEAINRLRARR
jgi:hypothetical protein